MTIEDIETAIREVITRDETPARLRPEDFGSLPELPALPAELPTVRASVYVHPEDYIHQVVAARVAAMEQPLPMDRLTRVLQATDGLPEIKRFSALDVLTLTSVALCSVVGLLVVLLN